MSIKSQLDDLVERVNNHEDTPNWYFWRKLDEVYAYKCEEHPYLLQVDERGRKVNYSETVHNYHYLFYPDFKNDEIIKDHQLEQLAKFLIAPNETYKWIHENQGDKIIETHEDIDIISLYRLETILDDFEVIDNASLEDNVLTVEVEDDTYKIEIGEDEYLVNKNGQELTIDNKDELISETTGYNPRK